MNSQRRALLIAATLMSFLPLGRAADKAEQNAVYRALFRYFQRKATDSLHLFISENPAQAVEVFGETPQDMPHSKRLEGLVPATTESLRKRFLDALGARDPINVSDLAFEGRLKITLVSRQEPKAIFENWTEFRERFPDAKGLMRISHAAIDDDAQMALVYAGLWCGGTCGGGYLFLLAKLKDGWRVVHDQVLWVA
jgi:hypothetical protein